MLTLHYFITIAKTITFAIVEFYILIYKNVNAN